MLGGELWVGIGVVAVVTAGPVVALPEGAAAAAAAGAAAAGAAVTAGAAPGAAPAAVAGVVVIVVSVGVVMTRPPPRWVRC
ncbi:hypothetical protein IX55_03580 [Paracoccus sanguinis]|nr:hypothetical protein IX55_03580 [Paracoccus sanguinis]